MKILFAGGGTAGHINPALAVAGYIRSRHPEAQLCYIGTKKGLESKLVPEQILIFTPSTDSHVKFAIQEKPVTLYLRQNLKTSI